MKHWVRIVMPLAVAIAIVVPNVAASAAPASYVALGDSYSSGVGTNRYDLNASCSRSSLAYPALVAAAKGYALDFQACSGATTTDVINKQVATLAASTNLVTVTAGGNDAGFTSLLVNCTLTNCVSSINSTITWVNTQLAGRLNAMDSLIKSRAPNATVIVLGYPHLFTKTCFGALGVSASEVTAANNLADAMDSVTRTVAANNGFTYKSALAQFNNHGVCASTAWLNGLTLSALSSSYHPTATGQSSGYAPLVRQVTG